MPKCEKCIHKKICIDGANYKNAEACRNFVNEKDFAPVEHGYWDVGYFHDRVCSNCLHPSNDLDDRPYHFCPHCGAKMDKGSEENNNG